MSRLHTDGPKVRENKSVGLKNSGQSFYGKNTPSYQRQTQIQSNLSNYDQSLIPEFPTDMIHVRPSASRGSLNEERMENRTAKSRQKKTHELPQNALMIKQVDEQGINNLNGTQLSNANKLEVLNKNSKFERKMDNLSKQGGQAVKAGLFVELKEGNDSVGEPFVKVNLASGYNDKNVVPQERKTKTSRQMKSNKTVTNPEIMVPSLKGVDEKTNDERKNNKTLQIASQNSSNLIFQDEKISPTTTSRFHDIKYRCAFIRNIIDWGDTCQLQFKREKRMFHNFANPQYGLSLKDGDFVMNAKKQFGYFNSYYHISASKSNYQDKGQTFLGYLQGNFTGSEFNLFQNIEGNHQVVATIIYGSEFSCSSTYRKIEVYIKNPAVRDNLDAQAKKKSLKELYDADQNVSRRIIKLVTKQPQYHEKQDCFILNFRGKSKYPSIKNMILIEEEQPESYILMFCKNKQHGFHLEVASPLSPFIGMGIILSSFDFKLCSQ